MSQPGAVQQVTDLSGARNGIKDTVHGPLHLITKMIETPLLRQSGVTTLFLHYGLPSRALRTRSCAM
jgi:hypothetical protein